MVPDPARTPRRRTGRAPSEPRSADRPVVAVRDGIFFTVPEPLPRGRHKLSAEQVTATQRERLLAAVTELLAARGYRGFGVGDLAGRAGVSLGAFYRCFDGLEECIFAGYDRFIAVLLERMVAIEVSGGDRPALAAGLVGAYLETLAQDLVVARAYQVEIDALGPPARARRRDALTLFATHIRDRVAELSADGKPPPELPWSAYIGVVYAARQLVSDALDTDPEPDLVALGTEWQVWLLDLFRER